MARDNDQLRQRVHDLEMNARFAEKERRRATAMEAEKFVAQQELKEMSNKYEEAVHAVWELNHLRHTHAETLALLETRTKELTVAQQFLTTADSIPGADVIRMTAKLNSEITQYTASLADRLPARQPPGSDAHESKGTGDAAFSYKGWKESGVSHLLEAARVATDPSIAVQTAMQACLVNLCTHIINLWFHDDNVSIEQAFQGLYDMLRQTGACSRSMAETVF